MQMHRKHLAQHPIQPPARFQPQPHRPRPARSVRFERIRKTIVQATGARVAKAKGENFKGRDVRGQEATPEFKVEHGAPVCGTRTGRGGSRHDVKGLAEVGRVFVKVHQRAVERQVGFVCMQRMDGWVEGREQNRDVP